VHELALLPSSVVDSTVVKYTLLIFDIIDSGSTRLSPLISKIKRHL